VRLEVPHQDGCTEIGDEAGNHSTHQRHGEIRPRLRPEQLRHFEQAGRQDDRSREQKPEVGGGFVGLSLTINNGLVLS
jgi:hypothetical protein